MAYNIVPKNEKELAEVNENSAALIPMYQYIVKTFDFAQPFAFDKQYPTRVKLSRAIADDVDIPKWRELTGLTIQIGNGWRGSGSRNKGATFEDRFHTELLNYIEEGYEGITNARFVKAIEEIEALVPTNMYIANASHDGGRNTKRITTVSNKGVEQVARKVNIGEDVTDITVYLAKKGYSPETATDKLYLSLKHGNTVTFINMGVKQFIKQTEIESGAISNTAGQQILDLFGIDNERFCEVFNSYKGIKHSVAPKEYVDVTRQLATDRRFKEFLKSVIGYGYVMVHSKRSHIHVFTMDERKMNSYLSVKSAIIEYPLNGSAKRVDVKIELEGMSIKINIRASDGGVYPTHLFADKTS